MDSPQSPVPATVPQNTVTNIWVIITVVAAEALFALCGLGGTVFLCHTSNDPLLVATAAKMIQTDPSSAIAALQLLRTDAAIIAIVSGLTGVALGHLGGFLTNTRSQYAAHPEPAKSNLPMVRTNEAPGEAIVVTPVAAAPTTDLDPVDVFDNLPMTDPLDAVRMVTALGKRFRHVALVGSLAEQWQEAT